MGLGPGVSLGGGGGIGPFPNELTGREGGVENFGLKEFPEFALGRALPDFGNPILGLISINITE